MVSAMDRVPSLFVFFVCAIAVLVLGGLYSERITALIRRRAPRFWFEGEVFILWGLVVIAAFALGLTVMYLLTH